MDGRVGERMNVQEKGKNENEIETDRLNKRNERDSRSKNAQRYKNRSGTSRCVKGRERERWKMYEIAERERGDEEKRPT